MKKKVSSTAFLYILLLGFFLLMFLVFGYQVFPDSKSYVEGIATRKVIYPIFLHAFLSLYNSEDIALTVAAGIQGILGYGCLIVFLEYAKKHFVCKYLSAFGVLATYGVFALPHQNWIGNSIMTEALWWPLFLVWFVLLQKCLEESGLEKTFFALFGVETFLVLVKTQLLVFPICSSLMILIKRKKGENIKKLIFKILLSCVSILMVIPGTWVYKEVFPKANFSQINHYDYNLVANAFWVSKEEDVQRMEGTEAELFEELYQACKKDEYLYSMKKNDYAPLELQNYRTVNYDRVSYGAISDILENYEIAFSVEYGITLDEAGEKLSSILKTIELKIIMGNLWLFTEQYVLRFVEAIVRSIFVDYIYIRVLGLLVFLSFIILTVVNRSKLELFYASLTILALIIINSAAISIVIYPGMRYVSFAMGVFYILMIEQIIAHFKTVFKISIL